MPSLQSPSSARDVDLEKDTRPIDLAAYSRHIRESRGRRTATARELNAGVVRGDSPTFVDIDVEWESDTGAEPITQVDARPTDPPVSATRSTQNVPFLVLPKIELLEYELEDACFAVAKYIDGVTCVEQIARVSNLAPREVVRALGEMTLAGLVRFR